MHSAARVFGVPDFVHYKWDARAWHDVAPGDVVVFAEGSEHDVPDHPSFDDSEAVNHGAPYVAPHAFVGRTGF